ncbi:hypothetical protein [Streptomyces sp. NPDC091217]|uniref:hypothetical protein n=1 Tax=Streptomyces sp. NPDC091217 TaxID=3365975 RepID=UPI0037F8A877
MHVEAASDLDERMLLHDVADRLNSVADQLPLPDQIRADPVLSDLLDDEVRHLARLLGYLAGQHAVRHRAAARYPYQVTAAQRRLTLGLARAAEPAGAALASLGAAVHVLGSLADLSHQAPSPGRARAMATGLRQLTDRIAQTRTHLAEAAKHLRTAADNRPPSSAAPPASVTSAAPTRTH